MTGSIFFVLISGRRAPATPAETTSNSLPSNSEHGETAMIQKSYAAYETEEHLVKPYLLPDPLRNSDGTKVRTAQEWMNCRRPELLRLFQQEEYGEICRAPMEFHFISSPSGTMRWKIQPSGRKSDSILHRPTETLIRSFCFCICRNESKGPCRRFSD